MTKNNGVAHNVLDKLAKFEMGWSTKQGELVAKHNELAAQITAVEGVVKNIAAYTAAELGKFQGIVVGQIQQVGQALAGLDLNILALAEIQKEVFGQLTQIDAVLQRMHSTTKKIMVDSKISIDGQPVNPLTEQDIRDFKNALEFAQSDIEEIKDRAHTWFQELTTSAFKTVRDRLEKEAEEARAKAEEEQKAKEAAEKTAAETTSVEQECKDALLNEKTTIAAPTGGPGTDYPEGAEIFGGR